MALSSTEAEYMAAVEAAKELIWMRNFLSELGMKQRELLLHCDSQLHTSSQECCIPLPDQAYIEEVSLVAGVFTLVKKESLPS